MNNEKVLRKALSEQVGHMSFGSRTALILPKDYRPCLQLGLPKDHVTLLNCWWGHHPKAAKTLGLIEEIKHLIKVAKKKVHIYGVTGASGSGKDTFVDGCLVAPVNIRFGDTMKDMAYEFGMVPGDREFYEKNRYARNQTLDNGKTPLDAWIALDVIREYNPFIFVEKGLERLLWDHIKCSVGSYGNRNPIVFSGMRTELGLDVVRELADRMFRVVRKGHEPPVNATLDELQVLYPVDKIINNDAGLYQLELQSRACLL